MEAVVTVKFEADKINIIKQRLKYFQQSNQLRDRDTCYFPLAGSFAPSSM